MCCSLQDMLRILHVQKIPLERFHEKFAVQMNDTHPSIAVAELMRLLVDENAMDWDRAWHITRNTFGYTNHTLLPEALERWPIATFAKVLPRHLEIVYEINARFLDEARLRFFGDEARISRLSLIDENGERYVRMANLASVGMPCDQRRGGAAHPAAEAGRAARLRGAVAEKLSNKTNGVTPRRWMALANPRLASLITEAIGDGWLTHLERLRELEPYRRGFELPHALARDQARQQARLRAVRARAHRHRSSTRARCSTCR